MANTYKNIVITPNIGNTSDPKIQFSGGNTTANTDISLLVYPDSNGTLSFEGSAGQLFSITNDLSNSLFAVSDVSGIPSLEVFANGLVSAIPFGGNVVFGNSTASVLVNSTAFVGNVVATTISGNLTGNVVATTVNATTVNAATHSVGTAFTANATVVNAVSYYAGTLLVANTTVINATHLGGTAAASYVQNTESRTLSGNLNFTGSNTTVNAVFRVVNTTANVLFAGANGNIGIGTNSPAISLDVRGVIQGQAYDMPDTGTTAMWVKLGTFTPGTAPYGNSIRIRLNLHNGYNSSNSQDFYVDIFFKTSNGSSLDANGFAGNSFYASRGFNAHNITPKWVGNAAGVSATSYDLYISLPAYTFKSHYLVEISQGTTWTNLGTLSQTDPGAGSSTVLLSTAGYNVTVGNVGIGNTTPAHKLRVEGTTSLAGAVSGITTLAAGNTTITGFVNATSSVNAASLAVGTAFTANATVVNAVSYYAGTLLVANTTVINATHLAGKTEGNLNVNNATQLATTRTINGVNFNGTANILVPSLYDSNYRRITNPGGAEYVTTTATITGAIQVTLPVGGTDTMIRMTIKVYEYTTNESFEIHCGGYLYSVGPTWANNPFAYIVGNPSIDRRFTVRFGYTAGGKMCVYIGELASTWDYPQVYVTDVQLGYGGQAATFATGWAISFQSSAFENVTATISNPQVGYATSTSTASAVVLRDSSSNFSANNITANTTGIHTGNVSATIITASANLTVGSLLVANTTVINATHLAGYTFAAPSVLGSSTANGASLTYANVSGQVNTATLYATTSANIASAVQANATGVWTTGTVNAASHTVGTSLVANSLGVYHTGTVNAAVVSSTNATFTRVTNVVQAAGDLRVNLGTPSVEENALFHAQMNNKFRFIAPTSQEESTDGVTWTTSTRATAAQLGDLMIGEGQGTGFNAIPSGTVGTADYYRLTWNVYATTGYVYLNHLYIFAATQGNQVNFKIEALNNVTTLWETIASGTSSGWPAHFTLKHTTIPYHTTVQAGFYGQVRVTFTVASRTNTNSVVLYAMEWFGGYPNGRRNVESYDRLKNVTFPANVTSTSTFIGALSGTATNSTQLGGVAAVTIAESLRANRNITGGGTITVDASANILWSARFLVIANGRGTNFGTAGYFDITCPTSGTITGVGGAANKTATAAGIPLAVYEALYYILPIGSTNTSVAANFRVVSYTADVDIPSDWVLICVRNGDSGVVSFNNGINLLLNQSYNTTIWSSTTVPAANNTTYFGGYNWGAPAILGGTTANGASLTYANVSGQVNTATLYATTSANIASVTLANATGVYTTGTINAASHTVGTSTIANSTGVYVGANVAVNTSALFVGNSTINATYDEGGLYSSDSTVGTANFNSGGVTMSGLGASPNTASFYPGGLVFGNSAVVFNAGPDRLTLTNLSYVANLVASDLKMSADGGVSVGSTVNASGVYTTGTVNAASLTVGAAFTANATVINAVSYYSGTLLVANTTVINATHLAGVATTGYARRGGGIGSIDYNAERTRASGFYSVDAAPTNGPPGGTYSNYIQMTERGDTSAQIVVDYSTGQLYSRGIQTSTPTYSAWQTYLSTTANKTISGGFNVTVYNAGSASFTVNPLNGNYQYFTNNGAANISVPGSDCAVDLLIINGSTPGTITFTGGWQVGATGGSLNTTVGNEFIVSIRRIAGYSTYSIYAMQ